MKFNPGMLQSSNRCFGVEKMPVHVREQRKLSLLRMISRVQTNQLKKRLSREEIPVQPKIVSLHLKDLENNRLLNQTHHLSAHPPPLHPDLPPADSTITTTNPKAVYPHVLPVHQSTN
jgi:DNA-binding HxlR family transcriptional regulator